MILQENDGKPQKQYDAPQDWDLLSAPAAIIRAPRSDPFARRLTSVIMAHGLALAAHGQVTNSVSSTGTNAPAKLPDVVVQGEQGKAPDPFKPETVQSPKYTEPLRDIPQTITVVPRAVIQQQNATTLRDVLRNVPGISYQAGEGGGGLPGDNLSIRGFNARSDLFVDGVRDFGAYTRDPFNIESVEVTKGPSSSYAGRGSTGGSVNLVTKAPGLDSFYGADLGFGTDDFKRGTLDVNQSLKEVGLDSAAVRINALYHDADVPGRDVVSERRWALAPSVTLGLDTPTRLTLSYFVMEQDNVPQYGLPWVPEGNTNPVLRNYINKAPPVDFSNFYGLRDYDFEDVATHMGTVSVEHDFSDSFTLRNLTRLGSTHRDSAITAPRFVNFAVVDPITNTTNIFSDRLINRQLQRREMENDIFANQTDVRLNFGSGPIEHAVVTGLELSAEKQDNRNSAQATNQPRTDVFNPNPNDRPLGPMPEITGIPNEADARTAAVYAFDTIELGEKWNVSGGLRFDHVEADYRTGPNDFSQTDDLLSWRAALGFKPVEFGTIYFGCGTSFNPSIEAGNTGLSLATNNVGLDPEESRTFELGTKWDLLKERLSVTAALFRTEKVNARTPSLNPGDPQLVLDGEQVVQGVEFGVFGSITEKLRIFAGYTYMESEIEASNITPDVGAAFSNTPEHSGSVWLSYQLPWNIEIGAGAQYVGERLNNLSSNVNVREAPDYWLFDAMASYRVHKNLTVQLNVYNIADEEYIDRIGGGHFIPGVGRSAILTASLRF